MVPLSISPLWPLHALAQFHRLRAICAERQIPVETRLTELAGLGRFTKDESALCHDAVVARLKAASNIPASQATTHLGRIIWYTWMPIRVLCAHNPSLLSHPLLAECVSSVLFSDEALTRLQLLFPSPETDVMVVCQRLASHASGEMPAEAYIRSIPVWIQLRHDLEMSSAAASQ